MPLSADLLERVRARRAAAPGRPVVVLLSGGPRLRLPARPRGADRGRTGDARSTVDYGLRDVGRRGRGALRGAVRAARRDARRPPPAPARGAGNLQAWARDARYAAAARLADGGDVAAGHTASDQVETVLYRLAASPGRRALLGMAARDGRARAPAARRHARRRPPRTARRAGCRGARTPRTPRPRSRATALRPGLVPALRALHPAAEANVLRTLALLRDEAEVLDAAVDAALARGRRPAGASAALAALPPALARLAVQRLADRAAGGLAPAVGHRTEEVLALRRGRRARRRRRACAPVRGGALRSSPGRPRRSRARRP